MKIKLAVENENYAATIVRVSDVIPLEGSDNIVGVPFFGFQAITSKDVMIGDIGVVFPAGTQLSHEFCRENNLYRDKILNRDISKGGYFEKNRRVRAMNFRGHRSDCFFMPLSAFSHITPDPWNAFKVGDVFDSIDGHEICKKYIVPMSGGPQGAPAIRVTPRVDGKFFPKVDNQDSFLRYPDIIQDDAWIWVTQKLHGTSIRIGNTIVKTKLGLRDRVAKRLGVHVKETSYDVVYGSRRVIKDANDQDQAHYYESDIWTQAGKKIAHLIPEGFIVYGELIGWTPDGAPIQKGYTYDLPLGKSEIYIYRVSVITPSGYIVDLSWLEVTQFCQRMGLNHVPLVWSGWCKDFHVTEFLDKRFRDELYLHGTVLLSGHGDQYVDEGVCIRVDSLSPLIMKAKSPIFLQHESKMADQDVVDIDAT